MTITRPLLLVLLLTAAAATALTAQGPPRDRPAAQAGETEAAWLARGWNALAAGRVDEAVRAADQALAHWPSSHPAIGLKIEAHASALDVSAALNAYESWLLRRHEDAHLLGPVARATLQQIAAGGDVTLKVRALEALARSGRQDARDTLETMRERGEARVAIAAALARLGSLAATGELIAMAATDTPVDRSALAAALGTAGPAATPALTAMLTSARGPERAAAVRALGMSGAAQSLEQIRALATDQDPFVRTTVAVALARLGDPQGQSAVSQMLEVDVPEIRLMAAEAWNGQPGPWVAAIRPLLDDRDGTVRLQAARLIAPADPEAAARTLAEAAGDPNPVVRAETLRIVQETAGLDGALLETSQLRRLLRDPDTAVRLHAAAVLLERAR